LDPESIDEILIVPQFHYDIAYLQTEEQYYPRCFDNFRQAIALMEENPDYRYTIEQPFLVEAFEDRCPDDFARLIECHRRNQLEISGALYVIPDMNIPCGESLIRQVLHGKRYVASRFDVDVRVAWIADSWGHAPSLPQIMRHAGVDTYIFSRGMRPELRIGDFQWLGIDGTVIAANWLANSYSAIRFPTSAEIENAPDHNMVSASMDNLQTVASKLRSSLSQGTVLLGNGGDMAPPQSSAPAIVRAWRAHGLPVRFATIADYAAALNRNQDKLPRIDADFNPLFVGAQASRIRLKQLNRATENGLLTVEALHTALSIAGCATGLPDIQRAWRLCLKNQFHDIISGTVVDEAYHDCLRDYETAASDVAAAIESLGDQTSEPALFNPSGFAREEWAETSAGAGTVRVDAFSFAPLPTGDPPVETTTIALNDSATLENELWRITVAPSGVIASCIDVESGIEYAGGPWGNLVYKADNGDLWMLDHCPLDGGSVESQLIEAVADDPFRPRTAPLVNDSAVRQDCTRTARLLSMREGEMKLVVRGNLSFWRNGVDYETTILVRTGDPLIHFSTVCRPRGRRFRVYTCFETPWKDAAARHSIPFGAIVRDGKRYAGQNYVEALGPDGHGVRVLNAGLPGNAVNNGVASILLFRSVAMEYKAPSEDAFEEGQTLTFRYAVRPFTSADPGNAEREGERINRPFALVRAPSGIATGPLLTAEPDNVHVDAFYACDNGDVVLRVHECTGSSANGRIAFAAPVAAAYVSDGVETTGKMVAIDGNAVSVSLRPWQIATWRLRFMSR